MPLVRDAWASRKNGHTAVNFPSLPGETLVSRNGDLAVAARRAGRACSGDASESDEPAPAAAQTAKPARSKPAEPSEPSSAGMADQGPRYRGTTFYRRSNKWFAQYWAGGDEKKYKCVSF